MRLPDTGTEAEAIQEVLPVGKPPAPAPARTKKCPECGEQIPVRARTCRYCHYDLDEDDELLSPYKPCPRCNAQQSKRVSFTFWGSFYGPALFTHVQCPRCRYSYNGKTGKSNLVPAILFVTVPLVLILAIFGGLGYLIFRLRH
jgi:hypothetical protein